MNRVPVLSIVVPTHNRSALLARGLAALSQQTWAADEFEVVVVADACNDDTVEMAKAYAGQSPYTLRVLSHNARSAAATRNLGAGDAQGQVLLFLDDDVIARAGLVRAHMEAQAGDQVVLGYSKPALPQKPSWWQTDARRWWEDMYRVMRQPGHRFTYRDFWSGNVSMPSALFRRVGGFDARIRGRLEDYELGMRLLKAGVRFRHEPEAIGDHHDSTDLWQWLRRLREEGKADIQIGEQHPELRNSLFGFEEPDSRVMRTLRRLAFAHHRWGDRLEGLLVRQASVYERLRLRGRWRRVVGYLREYNYWRGIAAAIGERQKLSAWLQEAPLLPTVAADAPLIEMTALPSAPLSKDTLEQATRAGARLTIGGMEVLSLPPQPGAEPLREEHLRAALDDLLGQQFVPAVALQMLRAGGQESWAC